MRPPAAVTVLIADDDPDAREVLGEVLALMLPGVRTVFAVDGLDAVAVALDVCPWAVILDLGMPRMSGLDAAQRLQQRDGQGPADPHRRVGRLQAAARRLWRVRLLVAKADRGPSTRPLPGASDGVPRRLATDKGPQRPIEGEMLGATVARRAADAPLPHAGARCIPDSRARAAPCTASSRTRPGRAMPQPSQAFFAGRADCLAAAVDVCTLGRAARWTVARHRPRRLRRGGRTAAGGRQSLGGHAGFVADACCASALTQSARDRDRTKAPIALQATALRSPMSPPVPSPRASSVPVPAPARGAVSPRAWSCVANAARERRQRIAGRRRRRSIERPHSPAQRHHARQRERDRHAEVGAAART